MSILQAAKAVLTGDDRLKRRQGVKRELAEARFSQNKADLLRKRLKSLDDAADAEAAKHSATCEPLQAELAEIEESVISSLADHAPIDPATEARRAEILVALDAANRSLELQVGAIKSSRKPIETELREVQREANLVQVLENRLADERHGDPDLLDQLWLARSRVRVATAWEDAAKAQLRELHRQKDSALRGPNAPGELSAKFWLSQKQIDSPGTVPNPEVEQQFARPIHRARLELQAAQEMRSEASADIDRLRAELIDE